MKKLSSAQQAAHQNKGNRFALVEHVHSEYVPKESSSVVEVSADLVFTGNIYGLNFEIPSVADVAERDSYPNNLRYEGFLVYVEDIQETYQLRGGLDNSNWTPIAGSGAGTWGSIGGNIGDQNDLTALLSQYSQTGHTHNISDIVDLQNVLDNKSNVGHTHSIADIDLLQDFLDQTANINHNHQIAEVDGLQAVLDGKAAFQHTHVIAEISNLGLFSTSADGLVPKSQGANSNAFLKVDGTWVVPEVAAPDIVWGGLTGLLEDQADLQAALDSKAGLAVFNSEDNGLVPAVGLNTSQFLRGDGQWVSPDPTVISWGDIQGTVGDQTDIAVILNDKVDSSQVQTNVPPGALFTDTTYSQFTSTVQGLVPPSGGGTSTFLRADGSWVSINSAEWGNITGSLSAQVDLQNALNAKESIANRGIANGYASLDASGTVPASQLPSYVDDVIEVANFASFPVTGESGKIYIAIDTLAQYRWTGTTYMQLTSATAEWGSISGVLMAQTDLQAALNGKVNTSQVQTNVPPGAVFTDTTYSLFTDIASGLVPGSGGGTSSFLRADGTWAAPEGFPDAPADGEQYARQDNNWVVVEAGALVESTISLIDMGSILGAGDTAIDAGSFV